MAVSLHTHPVILRPPCPSVVPRPWAVPARIAGPVASLPSDDQPTSSRAGLELARREFVLGAVLASLLPAPQACAIQGYTAGRIPGLSAEPDASGLFTYTRPEGKSGGHGVGWSEIPQYSFKVPSGWGEIPVSIADLGGTEIDLRYTSQQQGDLAVVVAPVLRFADVGFNASITIETLGDPDKIIKGFGPELFGKPVEDDDILETKTTSKGGLTYYQWHVKPYFLVSATAYKNRMFIISTSCASRQWRKHEADLRTIMESFYVQTA